MAEDLAQRAVWALTGPTGTGKSELAVLCAEAVGGEVLGCDSVQLYRHFDVASAKPDPSLRARVPHHLVDCADWVAPWHAARWVAEARAKVGEIRGRGRVPILCGGTGLYLRALQHGLIAVPTDAALRARLTEAMRTDPAGTYAALSRLDPAGAAGISPHNPAYVVRALEICMLTGRPASLVRAEQAAEAARAPGRVPVRVLALDADNAWLRARLGQRADAMVAAGLLAEVAGLLGRGVAADCAPMRSVGYRQAVQVALGQAPTERLGEAIAQASWAYVRRQRTWLRREPPAATLDARLPQAELTAQALAAWRRGDEAAPAGG